MEGFFVFGSILAAAIQEEMYRIRYKEYGTPWFDLLLLSKEEMQKIVADIGCEVDPPIDSWSGENC